MSAGLPPLATQASFASFSLRSLLVALSTPTTWPARSSSFSIFSVLAVGTKTLKACCACGMRYIILLRSSVKNRPVSMPSKRLAFSAGIIAGKSMRMNTISRHRRLAMSLPISTLRPCSSPFSLRNCCGGKVGFTDSISLPASVRWDLSTLGVQVCAKAGKASSESRLIGRARSLVRMSFLHSLRGIAGRRRNNHATLF